MQKKLKAVLLGSVAGLINGLLGTGGGMITVPLLASLGLDPQKSHATSLAVIYPLTAMSAAVYLFRSQADPFSILPFLPAGIAGAIAGAFFLKKIRGIWLKKGFALLMIASALRLLLF